MRARWSTLVVAVTLLAGCSSGPVEVSAPEPPPATAVPEPAPAEAAPAIGVADAPAARVEAVVPEAGEPASPPGAGSTAPADDDPVLEGAARPAAPPRRAAAGPPTGAVQAASARTSAKPAPTGRIEIPAIGVNHVTYEGIDLATINHGPSHWPGTASPGQLGNSVFPGHRTTYSRPFWDLDKLASGNEVIFTTPSGRFTYRVTQTTIVGSRDTYVVNPTPDATFTLIACHPKGSARQRIVVKGTLVSALPPPAPTAPPTTKPSRGFLGIL